MTFMSGYRFLCHALPLMRNIVLFLALVKLTSEDVVYQNRQEIYQYH